MSYVNVVYVRDGHGKPHATVAMDDNGNYGVAICNYSVGDQFTKQEGRNKAVGRMLSKDERNIVPEVNRSIAAQVFNEEIRGIPVQLVVEYQLRDMIIEIIEQMKMKLEVYVA